MTDFSFAEIDRFLLYYTIQSVSSSEVSQMQANFPFTRIWSHHPSSRWLDYGGRMDLRVMWTVFCIVNWTTGRLQYFCSNCGNSKKEGPYLRLNIKTWFPPNKSLSKHILFIVVISINDVVDNDSFWREDLSSASQIKNYFHIKNNDISLLIDTLNCFEGKI